MQNRAAAAVLEIVRAGTSFLEVTATHYSFGPGVETIARGVYGDRRDSPHSWVLMETPASSLPYLRTFLAVPDIAEQVVQVHYCDVAPQPYPAGGLPRLAVYRPVPEGPMEDPAWTWAHFAHADAYREVWHKWLAANQR